MGYRTQTEWDKARQAVKAKAAKTIKADAAKAQKAKDKARGITPDAKPKATEEDSSQDATS